MDNYPIFRAKKNPVGSGILQLAMFDYQRI